MLRWAWLFKPCPSERRQIMLALGLAFEGHLACEPCEREIGLHAKQGLERVLGQLALLGHCGGGGQHTMGAYEVVTKTQRLARQLDRLLIIAADELAIG